MRQSKLHALILQSLLLWASCYANTDLDNELEIKRAEPCNPQICQAPNCRCSGITLLKEEFRGHEPEIPQLITVTFDDAVNTINFEQYIELFKGLVNPDNCSAQATFFVSHEYTDYVKVHELYVEGHEIALHSVTHGTGSDYWRKASVELMMREFGDQIQILEKFAKVDRKNIRGMRLPFLQLSGNNSFVAAKKLGLLYDSSMPTQKYQNPAMWPYTLDYLSDQDCQIGPCPNAAVPGFWVSPMVSWTDMQNYSCAMIDGCIYLPEDNVDELFSWMLSNFERHYKGNRAPFGMYLHAAWFQRSNNYFQAFKKFLQYANSLPDVYLTTMSRVIQYMHHPSLEKPFKGCLKKPHVDCSPVSCNVVKRETGEIRYMTVCDECPAVYPWLDNPLGEMQAEIHAGNQTANPAGNTTEIQAKNQTEIQAGNHSGIQTTEKQTEIHAA